MKANELLKDIEQTIEFYEEHFVAKSDKSETTVEYEKLYKVMINIRFHTENTFFYPQAICNLKVIQRATYKEFINSQIPIYKKLLLISFLQSPFIYRTFMHACSIYTKISHKK